MLPVVEGSAFVDGGVRFVGIAHQVVGVVGLIVVIGHLAVGGWLLG